MRISFFLLFLGTVSAIFAQEKPQEPPRLVVGIKIDGLQADHLRQMEGYFTPGGFRKITTESLYAEQLHHLIAAGGSAADAATYLTGAPPFYHGICGDSLFQKSDNRVVSTLWDSNQSGIGTRDKFSAHRLLTTTLADELAMSHPQAKIHAVAISAEDAIMLGGHAATSVSWMDDKAYRWVTTTYYANGLSRWADAMNVDGSFKQIVSEKWIPAASISTYRFPTLKGSRSEPFSYNIQEAKNRSTPSSILKNTPAANRLVAELAKRILTKEPLGTGKNTDMLLLHFTVETAQESGLGLHSAEQEDMYLRLDRDLQSVLHAVHTQVGIGNALIFVIGTGGSAHTPAALRKNNIPSGVFNADRALALLNTYLMVIYGQEKWIAGYCDRNIYLNKKKIEEKRLNLSEFTDRVTDFLMEFEGVQAAYAYRNIVNFSGDASDMRMKLRNTYHPSRSGDIVFTLKPGWMEANGTGKTSPTRLFVPFYLLGKGIKSKRVAATYTTFDVAPTVANSMGIPAPNGAVGVIMR